MKKHAFSLIEIMISLIVISVVTAAFTPIISKKLQSQGISIGAGAGDGGGGSLETKCEHIHPNCLMCQGNKCLMCDGATSCGADRYYDLQNCTCKECPENYICDGKNKTCPAAKYIDKQGNCKECESGYTKYPDSTACLKCSTISHCTSCSTEGCEECEQDFDVSEDKYTCEKSKWISIPSGGNLISKYNAGDKGGPAIPETVSVCTAGNDCNFGGNIPTCWKGVTSTACARAADDKYAEYDSCTRTVCNWYAANLICGRYGGLPTTTQMIAFKAYTNADSEYNPYFCNTSASGTYFPQCANSSDKCFNATNNACYTQDLWAARAPGSTQAYHVWAADSNFSGINSAAATMDYAYGVRCLKNCGPGKNLINGQCVDCPEGKYCPTTGRQEICSKGTYALPGASSCTACTSPNVATAEGSTACTACAAKTYWINATTCKTCEKGWKCAGGADHTACTSPNVATAEGSTACSACAAGRYWTNASTCAECGKGFYCTGGAARASCATAGKVCPHTTCTAAACSTCPAGQYKNSTSTCTNCPGGSICSAAGCNSCSACAKGQYKATNSTCTACAANAVCVSGGCGSCSVCAAGTWRTSASACTQCTAGWACSGGAAHTQCSGASVCTGAGCKACSTCPVKTYRSSASTCTGCASGYCAEAGATACFQRNNGSNVTQYTSWTTGSQNCQTSLYAYIGARCNFSTTWIQARSFTDYCAKGIPGYSQQTSTDSGGARHYRCVYCTGKWTFQR